MSKLILFLALAMVAPAQVLLQTDFAQGAADWTGANQAFVSDLCRRPGGKSLQLRQWADAEQDSAWLSPLLAADGQPLKISFWGADNYLKQTDASYAATVDVISYAADGSELETSQYLKSVPWDDSRKSDLWGQRLPAGLVWQYFEAVYRPKGKTCRLKLYWPKPIVRGECYFTDLMVTVATPADLAAAAPGAKPATTSRYALELSTASLGNVFYAGDPLRFEALLFSTDQQPLGAVESPTIRYEITDFGNFFIARGELPFDQAEPVADPAFYKSAVGRDRAHNVRQTIPISDPAAVIPGREFFIHAELRQGEQLLAADTVTYGVMDPRPIAAEDYGRCRFSSTFFSEGFKDARSPRANQSISVKSGVMRKHLLDYYWIRTQPTYPGPITFKNTLPAYPPLIVCPNIEQERSSDEWLRRTVPPECLIADPLRPGRLTFMIDPYVAYIVAYIRHHRQAIVGVIPSGLERPIDARTVELHKKAYAAIKKEWPELPVGMMLYGLPMNPSADVDIFLDHQLYDFTDFVDTHIYAASVDWSEWQRLQRAYLKMGRQPPPLISTEFCRVGGSDQILHSRDTVAAHLDAFANGMHHVYYFNQCNEEQKEYLRHPFLRGATDLGGSMTSGFLYLQKVSRPRVSPDLVSERPDLRWHSASWGYEYGGDTLMPVLQTMTYYNLVQNFELADFRIKFEPSPNAVGYVFDRGEQTICALWLTKPVPSETMLIRGDTSYVAQDLFGRASRITPVAGTSLVSIDENPLTLVFDHRDALTTPRDQVRRVDGGLRPRAVARGGSAAAAVVVPGVFPADLTVTLSCTVDGTWPTVPETALQLVAGTAATTELPITIDLDRATGAYPLTVSMVADGKLAGLLRAPLLVKELLELSITGVPMTDRPPAIEVTVTSLRDQDAAGIVRLQNRFQALDYRPEVQTQRYAAPALGTTTLRFELPPEQVSLTTDYEVVVELQDDSGIALTRAAAVGFRATRRAPGTINIDGDLSDWQLSQQTAIPFSRLFTGWGKPWHGPEDLSGVFYTLWDDDYLYFAAEIKDDSAVSRANTIDIWMDDNIMLGLYPWGWQSGEMLNSGYYREHLGRCLDGTARIFRVGNVAVGPATADDAQIAVIRTADGYRYEWAYPRACIAPMALREGGRFRLSLFPWDVDVDETGKDGYSKLGGMQFGGFNANVDARPEKWREFVLTR